MERHISRGAGGHQSGAEASRARDWSHRSGLRSAIGASVPVASAQESGLASREGVRPRSATTPGCSAPTRSRRRGGELERIARETGASIIIETVDTLEGEPADRVAVNLRRAVGHPGHLHPDRPEGAEARGAGLRPLSSEVLTDAHRRAIRDAFFEGFRRQDFNEGLKLGVAAIARVHGVGPARRGEMRPMRRSPEAPLGISTGTAAMTFGPKSAGDSPLVVRNQVRLTLAGRARSSRGPRRRPRRWA